mmetsp:Transcript_6280/g.21538  ORF Transcript_6280/g.21538 Transcript_6280/m.21538 type:complete len:224 (+) Transcript_6280:725-1396(+)
MGPPRRPSESRSALTSLGLAGGRISLRYAPKRTLRRFTSSAASLQTLTLKSLEDDDLLWPPRSGARPLPESKPSTIPRSACPHRFTLLSITTNSLTSFETQRRLRWQHARSVSSSRCLWSKLCVSRSSSFAMQRRIGCETQRSAFLSTASSFARSASREATRSREQDEDSRSIRRTSSLAERAASAGADDDDAMAARSRASAAPRTPWRAEEGFSISRSVVTA